MPVFLDGQQNLAALSVPGVYGDIILPTPTLLGLPTNIEGLVGVASWGPLNAIIPVSKPSDGAVALGPPVIRTYDMMSYISAATQVGGAIGFLCIRVSDGTDTAATGTYPTSASGLLTINGVATAAQNVVIGAVTIAMVAAITSGPQCLIATTPAQQAQNLLAAIAQYVPLVNATLAPNSTPAVPVILIAANASGVSGNALVTTTTVTNFAFSGATLLNGGTSGLTITGKCSGIVGNQITFNIVNGTKAGSYMLIVSFPGSVPEQFNNITGTFGAGATFWTNAVSAINNGNAFHGPSQYVIATVPGSPTTGAPPLAFPLTLTGGTDGTSGMTDAILVGQDIVPRKGMYVLRSSNVDCFTLCDLQTVAQYAAIVSFGLSETCLPILATTSGDTIADALAIRINAGVDSPWMWLILGDWPTWYDSYNQVSRLINPSAFGIGIVGNLSPQQSPLNKPLQGISATQRSVLGQTYSEVELSQINLGGIDTILPPSTSPGGYYFSFATGRNASSNTAANGIEYTRMTDFLIRAAQSKAAGSFVGQLQSIQPSDQTRQNAKALFDGFSAQLASSEVGLGIGGSGIIDRPWLVICDLTNNPPPLQALGYLFLYWQVRYLNVIRYFVVKFQGGGNVTVSVQNTPPTPQQFFSGANTTSF